MDTHIIILDNYPLWLFDKMKYVEEGGGESYVFNEETMGFRLVTAQQKNAYEKNQQHHTHKIYNLLSFMYSIVSCFYDKQESDHVRSGDSVRSVYINTLEIATTDFDLDDSKQEALVLSGQAAVDEYLRRSESRKRHALIDITKETLASMAPFFKSYSVEFQKGTKSLNIRNVTLHETPTMLYDSCVKNNPQELLLLKELDVNWNVQDDNGDNALHMAASKGNEYAVERLVRRYGLNVNAVNQAGESALDIALKLDNAPTRRTAVRRLVKNGVMLCKNQETFEKVKTILEDIVQYFQKPSDAEILVAFCKYHNDSGSYKNDGAVQASKILEQSSNNLLIDTPLTATRKRTGRFHAPAVSFDASDMTTATLVPEDLVVTPPSSEDGAPSKSINLNV